MAALNPAAAPMTPAEVSVLIENGKFVFRTDDGHWIYVSDADKPGESVCVEDCTKKWRPVMAPGAGRPVGAWTTVARKDGKQWAYKGRPIYTFAETKIVPPGTEPGWQAINP